MSRSTKPTSPGPGRTTADPAISGAGSGMGAGPAAGTPGGVQAGTMNDAAQGSDAGDADDPSLGSGMSVSRRGNRMGDAGTAGAPGMDDKPPGTGAAPIEPNGRPDKVNAPPKAGH